MSDDPFMRDGVRPSVRQRQAAGRTARDAGMAQVEQHADPRVILAIDAAIERAIDAGLPFSANDIRDEFPVADQHLVGARFNSFRLRRVKHQDGTTRPLMIKVGTVQSNLLSTHAHGIALWQRTDAVQPTLWGVVA